MYFLVRTAVLLAVGLYTVGKSNRVRLNALQNLIGPGSDLAGGRPGPSGVFGISERDLLSNYRVLKIKGFGGRPPAGGRHGARGPRPPKSGPG